MVWYEHLGLFNLLAMGMLSLGVVALASSLAGLWRARLRRGASRRPEGKCIGRLG